MGRHRRPHAGLPRPLAAAAIAAALCGTVALTQPPAEGPVLPEPVHAAAPSATGAPTTTQAPTTTAAPTATHRPPAAVMTRPKPAPTTAPKPAAPVVAKASAKCTGLGVAANVRAACEAITAAIPGIPLIGGLGARPDNPTSCHPHGLALDLMVYRDKALGDRIYAYAKAHKAELGITTILWQVPNHWDHVHLSLTPCQH